MMLSRQLFDSRYRPQVIDARHGWLARLIVQTASFGERLRSRKALRVRGGEADPDMAGIDAMLPGKWG
jgi:hypothetical protein